MTNERKGRHLTENERYSISRFLTQGLNFKEIGELLGKDATTISKEIKKHCVMRKAGATGYPARIYQCVRASSCKKRKVCGRERCRIPCRKCPHCRLHCDRFKPLRCDIKKKPPFCCNGCEKRLGNKCKEDKYYYVAEFAQKEYRRMLKESREGIDCTRDEIALIEGLVAPLIKKGQPLSHIYAHHKDEILISKRTFYRYVHDGDIGIMSIDLRRAVRYRPRKRVRVPKPDPVRKIGHTYDCFQAYIKENPSVRVTEMDTVEGRKGGKLLMTMFMRDVSLMLIFLIDSKEIANTIGVIDTVEELIKPAALADLIPLILGDNGPEFSDPSRFEANADGVVRTMMFYTEPYHTNQKARLERSHEYIRYILPKGSSFDSLMPEDATLIANNVNSFARKSLGDKSPFDLAIKKGLGPILEKLGMRPVPPDEVNLTRSLIKKPNKV